MNGLRVVPSVLAVEYREEWTVERSPIRKRRKNYRVVRRTREIPCAYRVGNTIYAHPDAIAMII